MLQEPEGIKADDRGPTPSFPRRDGGAWDPQTVANRLNAGAAHLFADPMVVGLAQLNGWRRGRGHAYQLCTRPPAGLYAF